MTAFGVALTGLTLLLIGSLYFFWRLAPGATVIVVPQAAAE